MDQFDNEKPEKDSSDLSSLNEEDHISSAAGNESQAKQADKRSEIDDFDPAQKSLSDALRVSFLVLKVVMIIAVIAYICSGIFQVSEHERALRLRFGKIAGQPGEQVYGPGWHFGFPYPIEQVVRVSIQPRTINITNEYWYSGNQQRGPRQTLDPLKDGSLLTGDANIVHARFQVVYKVTDPVAFEKNIGGSTSRSDSVVASVAKQAIVIAAAQATADSVIRGDANQAKAKTFMQKVLNQMHAGLTITSVTLSNKSMPQAVHEAYQAVINAKNQRAKAISNARKQRTQILGGAAGEAGLPQGGGQPSPLIELVNKYEFATQAGDTARASKLKTRLEQSLSTLVITGSDGLKVSIGGKVASIINKAKSYGDKVGQEILAESNNFNKLFAEYKKNPRILAGRLWQNAREKIFSGNVETFYTLPGRYYIVTNRSPKVQQKLRRQALQAAQKAAKAEEGQGQ